MPEEQKALIGEWHEVTDRYDDLFNSRYLTGEEAWEWMKDRDDTTEDTMRDVWGDPNDYKWAPFQYCSHNGESGSVSHSIHQIGCLTQVAGSENADEANYVGQLAEWAPAILADELVPGDSRAFDRMYDNGELDKFIACWNRCVEWQQAMRLEVMPDVRN